MDGMLKQAQAPQPGSGPGPQTPPAGSPGAGTPPPGSAGGPGQPPAQKPDAKTLRDDAIRLLYDERYDQLINMFETNGPEQFPRSMAVAINTVISEAEKKYGQTDHEMAAQIGIEVMGMLLQDIVGEKVMDVPVEKIGEVMPAAMMMYADGHPDVSKQDIQAVMQSAQQEMAAQQGGQADPNAPLSTGPGPEPSGSPVPPGVTV